MKTFYKNPNHLKCDLHIHSNCSDGMFTPEKIVALAKEKGLDCISITDHDTVEGVKRAREEGNKVGIKVVSGIELSSFGKCDVHVLGYNLDFDAPGFDEAMKRIASFRLERNRLLQEKLHEHGFEIDVMHLKDFGSIGRCDVASAMVEKGYCSNVTEAFDKYLGTDKPCYVQSERLTPVEAVQFILRFGGIPVLAHPKNLHMPFGQFESFLKPLVLAGLGGIEADYFTHTNAERKFYSRMAREYKLVITGGSDFHDYTHGVAVGSQYYSPSSYTRKILGL